MKYCFEERHATVVFSQQQQGRGAAQWDTKVPEAGVVADRVGDIDGEGVRPGGAEVLTTIVARAAARAAAAVGNSLWASVLYSQRRAGLHFWLYELSCGCNRNAACTR